MNDHGLPRANSRIPNILAGLAIVFHKDAALIMLTHGIFYTTYSCIQASLSTIFIKIYHFTGVQVGFIYLPFGIGCLLASYLTGMSP